MAGGPEVNPLPASVEPNPLRLAPEPGAAREARAWIEDALTGWPDEAVETARLVLSELVTNSVLHAGTPIVVAYRRDGEHARFEVSDAVQAGPLPKRYGPDSATGRGLRLVASLADEWGVSRDVEGKSVWFTVTTSTPAMPLLEELSLQDELGTYSDDPSDGPATATAATATAATATAATATAATATAATGVAPPAAPTGSPDWVDVKVLGLPIDVYLEAEQHNDAVRRELTLIVQSAKATSGIEVPRRLLELADEVRTTFLPQSGGPRAQVEEAVRHGREKVDIDVAVPREGWQAFLRLADWLDEVDRYCVEGDLLTLASSPRLGRFRRWFAMQVADQMAGLPPTPWEPTA